MTESVSIRFRNPGAMGRGDIALKWGAAPEAVALHDGTGQGNTIAVFPTYVQGICAQLDLWRTSPHYRNKRFVDAIAVWSGGNEVESYIRLVLARVPGMTRDTVMDDAFWKSPNGIAFLKAQAFHEAGKTYPAPDADWIEAQRRVFGVASAAPAIATSGAPSIAALVPPGTFYRMGASGATVKQIQIALGKIGYPLTGTGYFGPATDTAVEAFQKRAGLTVDGDFGNASALALDRALGTDLAAVPAPTKAEIGQPLWLQAGIKLIGTKETPGAKDNQTIIDWAREEGDNIAAAYTHDSIPWCALFAGHCLTRAGLKGTGTLWALDFAGKWPSVKLLGPAVGAFAPMVRNGGGHIIQVVGKDQNGNIMGLGGNQSDQVSIEPFPMSRLNKGFWWPSSVVVPKATGMSALPVVKSDGRVSSNEA